VRADSEQKTAVRKAVELTGYKENSERDFISLILKLAAK